MPDPPSHEHTRKQAAAGPPPNRKDMKANVQSCSEHTRHQPIRQQHAPTLPHHSNLPPVHRAPGPCTWNSRRGVNHVLMPYLPQHERQPAHCSRCARASPSTALLRVRTHTHPRALTHEAGPTADTTARLPPTNHTHQAMHQPAPADQHRPPRHQPPAPSPTFRSHTREPDTLQTHQ